MHFGVVGLLIKGFGCDPFEDKLGEKYLDANLKVEFREAVGRKLGKLGSLSYLIVRIELLSVLKNEDLQTLGLSIVASFI